MKAMQQTRRVDLRLLLLAGFALLVLGANILLLIYYRSNRSEIERSHTRAIHDEFEITMGVYSDMADSIYHLYIDAPRVKALFQRGVQARDAAIQDRFRSLLHDELAGVYQKLRQYDFRQLHFHEKNNRSYLRFHRPEKYGDDLTAIRYSVAYVNRVKKYIRGFEEGAIFNGYRFVYPIFVNGEHVGSVEVSVSMNAVIRQFRERFGKEAQFIIRKRQVVEKVQASERANYVDWFVDDRFVLDRAISGTCILEKRITEKDAARIRTALGEKLATGLPFCLKVAFGGESCVLTFLPIRNFNEKLVAYIFQVSDGKAFTDLAGHFYVVSGTLITLFLLLVVFMVYYRLSQKTIERMAIFDALTNVYSRGALMRILDTEFERYVRYKKPFSLVMIDVDHFKRINDEFGHNVGDLVLSGIAAIMRKGVRKSDVVGRYGGEEFLLLLPETPQAGAATMAENLRAAICAHDFHRVGKVTVSCGVTEMHAGARTAEGLIGEADKKLYRAKHEGRNRVVA